MFSLLLKAQSVLRDLCLSFLSENMNSIKTFFVIAIFLFGLSGCGTFTKNNVPQNVLQSESCQCYWMENYSGLYKWIPSESIQGMKRKITKAECYKLDSCDGGLGHSNGGCYKWALGPENTRISW